MSFYKRVFSQNSQHCLIGDSRPVVKVHLCEAIQLCLEHCWPQICFQPLEATDAPLTGAAGNRKGANNPQHSVAMLGKSCCHTEE